MACASDEERLARKRSYMAAYRAADPRRAADIKLRHQFGISLDDYEAMLDSQGGGCRICGTSVPGGRGRFHVDHDHNCCPGKRSCGKCVRALLCTNCNVGIAMFKDDPDILRKAAEYVVQQFVY